MINKNICQGTGDITPDFDRHNGNINYNVQILRLDFTIDPHMKVIFEKPYKSNGILKRMILKISYKEGT